MTTRPVMILRYGPAFETREPPPAPAPLAGAVNPDRVSTERAKAKGPVIEMTAHKEDGGHFVSADAHASRVSESKPAPVR